MYENEIETNITWIPENTLKSVFRIHNVRNISSLKGGGGGAFDHYTGLCLIRSVNAPGLPGGMLKFRIGAWVNFNTDWCNIENVIESV